MEVDQMLALSPVVGHEIRSVLILWKNYSVEIKKNCCNNENIIDKEA